MELSFVLGFILMWIALFLARSISVKEVRKLDEKKKAELVDMAAARRAMQFAVLIVGIGAFYLISYFIDQQRELWFGLYGLCILLWMAYRLFSALNLFRSRGFNEDFIRSQYVAGLIRIAGILAFFACVGLNFVFY